MGMKCTRRKPCILQTFKRQKVPNGMIRVRTGVAVLTEGLRYYRSTVVKLRDMGDRQCLKLSGLL